MYMAFFCDRHAQTYSEFDPAKNQQRATALPPPSAAPQNAVPEGGQDEEADGKWDEVMGGNYPPGVC